MIDPGAGRVESFGSLSVTGNLLDWYGAVATPDGQTVEAAIPDGLQPGATFTVFYTPLPQSPGPGDELCGLRSYNLSDSVYVPRGQKCHRHSINVKKCHICSM